MESIKPMLKIRNIPQPFPYQGSKRKLAPQIVQCIPDDTNFFIEPFAGSAAVSIAVAWSGKARKFWLNDTHIALIDLWKRIIRDPESLSNDYKNIWDAQLGRERDYYNEIRDNFNNTHRPELFLFLLARCVKAAIRYNQQGKFNNSPDHRRQGMQPHTMAKNIKLVSEILGKATKITCLDYKKVLKEATPIDLVYMDPPYQGVCKERDCRYINSIEYDEFVSELEELNRREVPFIVSYDGRTGDKVYGKKLPDHLKLYHTELLVGRSTQATLLGRNHNTYESLYLSSCIVDKIKKIPDCISEAQEVALLF